MKFYSSLPPVLFLLSQLFLKFYMRLLTGILLTFLLSISAFAQQGNGSLRGSVVDPNGAIVPNATVTATNNQTGASKTATSSETGEYTITNLPAGAYTVRAEAATFTPYENAEITVAAGQREELTITLNVAIEQQVVNVPTETPVSTDPENNASATVLRGQDLESLPEDPDELAAALQALAGPAAGPNGGQFFIDGFTGGRIPPREAIREIRINSNPFSAEYDRIGFGRVEILTRPGFDRLRGQAFFNFNDESLNSRNPFAPFRAPTQTRAFGGNLSGPIVKKKSSYFLDVDYRDIADNAVINLTTLDPTNASIVRFTDAVVTPTKRFSISPRFDIALNDKNNLTARYSYNNNARDNVGLNELTLLSRAFITRRNEHQVQLTETAILNSTTINETRFQYIRGNNRSEGDNSIPAISVAGAFQGGGAQIGLLDNTEDRFELQNYTTFTVGSKQNLKAGARLRSVRLSNFSQQNFGGTFIFAGLPAVRAANGVDVLVPGVDSIEQYRQRVLGNRDQRFNPTQFTITAGDPQANVSQFDIGGFVTDDWRVRPDLTLSFGLRYENQNNIGDNLNFAPRFGFAYSPGAGGARAPKTVIRGGGGIFFDRFGENNVLQAERFNGTRQQSYVITNQTAAGQALLNQVVFTADGRALNVPTIAQIQAGGVANPNTINIIADNLRVPRTTQGLISVERQLPFKITGSLTYIAAVTNNALALRNVNAPLCPPTAALNCAATAARPLGTRDVVILYDTSGKTTSQFLNFNFRTGFNSRYTFFGNYRLGSVRGNTDGGFPSYSYDLDFDQGRLAFDTRHNFFFGGSFTAPYGIQLFPNIIASSGRPFNITTGVDTNGDTFFTERPTFAGLAAACARRNLTNSFCDVSGKDPNAIVPRNYGVGPGIFTVNLRTQKTFGFGKSRAAAAQNQGAGQQGQGQAGAGRGAGTGAGTGFPGGGIPGANGGRGGAGGGGGRRGFGGVNSDKPYNLTFGVNFANLFNRNNRANPIGNISSPLFGQSISTVGGFFGGFGGGGFGGGTNAGNRRVELQLRFSF